MFSDTASPVNRVRHAIEGRLPHARIHEHEFHSFLASDDVPQEVHEAVSKFLFASAPFPTVNDFNPKIFERNWHKTP